MQLQELGSGPKLRSPMMSSMLATFLWSLSTSTRHGRELGETSWVNNRVFRNQVREVNLHRNPKKVRRSSTKVNLINQGDIAAWHSSGPFA